MLSVDTDWVWDFWLADDGDRFHLFYLHAPRSLGDESRRHRAARIGHAVSDDLRDWSVLGDIFDAGQPGDFDATATWTGSVVRGADGLWRMFYTGARFTGPEPDVRNVETVGVAVSPDLYRWEKQPGPIVAADPRWYETFGTSSWREEAWRDPWVYADPSGDAWHMLVTARSNRGPDDERGVIGHAVSRDLQTWTVRPPITSPGLGFQHMEVPQLLVTGDGARSILFSCPRMALADRFQTETTRRPVGGVWALPIGAVGRAIVDAEPVLVIGEQYYSARLLHDRDGELQMLAVENARPDGDFIGRISDPIPVALDADAIPHLLLQPAPAA